MKQFARILLISGLLEAALFGAAFAQIADNSQESISNFSSNITVNLDNSVDVTEVIDYNTGPQARHGIYRDIYPFSSEGRAMDITNISVTDAHGDPYQWVRQSYGSDVRLKIGDPDITFTGSKEYIISYHATRAVGHPDKANVDEIYWNATGNDWLIPIYRAEVVIKLPTGIASSQQACYYGPKGSTLKCSVIHEADGTYSASLAAPLNPGEGLTVAVGFPKGTMPAYTSADDVSNVAHQYSSWIIALLIPLLVFVFMFVKWHKKGRDPKGKGVIIPQYDVPNGLTPMEVGCIINQAIGNKDISAELIYLATQGYIKIKRIEDKLLGFIKTTDYELQLLKNYSDLPNQFDIALMDGIFDGDTLAGTTVKLSDLKNKFYIKIPDISRAVASAMLAKGYYSNLPSATPRSGSPKSVGIIFFVVWIIVGIGTTSIQAIGVGIVPLIISIVLAFIIYFVMNSLMPAKTVMGVEAKEHLLGLKDYLQIAEKDRLKFHNAPEKKPETFERLLPYAVVFNVETAWAKEFQDIYTTPPGWYEGYPVEGSFNVMLFTNSLANFSSTATSSLASAPGGGGSSGGGFSGGGGGGGGGGGW